MKKNIFIILLFFLILSCGANKNEISNEELKNPYSIYEEGIEAFQKNDYFFASKKFSEAELNFEQLDHAAKSALMASYSLYAINFYDEALENIERYLKVYKSDKNIIYAQYLKALIFYDQINDEKRDIEPTVKANQQIDFFLKEYPGSDYAIDLNFKKELILNQLAAKEIYVARFYISTKSGYNDSKIKDNCRTIWKNNFYRGALHRLVEVYYYLGMEKEAKNYASILGYNYNSSQWFEESYKIFNKTYKPLKRVSDKEDDSLLKNIFKKIRIN